MNLENILLLKKSAKIDLILTYSTSFVLLFLSIFGINDDNPVVFVFSIFAALLSVYQLFATLKYRAEITIYDTMISNHKNNN